MPEYDQEGDNSPQEMVGDPPETERAATLSDRARRAVRREEAARKRAAREAEIGRGLQNFTTDAMRTLVRLREQPEISVLGQKALEIIGHAHRQLDEMLQKEFPGKPTLEELTQVVVELKELGETHQALLESLAMLITAEPNTALEALQQAKNGSDLASYVQLLNYLKEVGYRAPSVRLATAPAVATQTTPKGPAQANGTSVTPGMGVPRPESPNTPPASNLAKRFENVGSPKSRTDLSEAFRADDSDEYWPHEAVHVLKLDWTPKENGGADYKGPKDRSPEGRRVMFLARGTASVHEWWCEVSLIARQGRWTRENTLLNVRRFFLQEEVREYLRCQEQAQEFGVGSAAGHAGHIPTLTDLLILLKSTFRSSDNGLKLLDEYERRETMNHEDPRTYYAALCKLVNQINSSSCGRRIGRQELYFKYRRTLAPAVRKAVEVMHQVEENSAEEMRYIDMETLIKSAQRAHEQLLPLKAQLRRREVEARLRAKNGMHRLRARLTRKFNHRMQHVLGSEAKTKQKDIQMLKNKYHKDPWKYDGRQVSLEDRALYKRHNLCFRCAAPDHRSFECPYKNPNEGEKNRGANGGWNGKRKGNHSTTNARAKAIKHTDHDGSEREREADVGEEEITTILNAYQHVQPPSFV